MKICPICDTTYGSGYTTCSHDGVTLVDVEGLEPGQIVRSKYRIVEKIGQGGMGAVYLADDAHLGMQIALKFPSPAFRTDPVFIKRFREEARRSFSIQHPNITHVTGLDQAEDGGLFIVMEYISGGDLRTLLDQFPGGLPIERALALAKGIAQGLGAAHAMGYVHRDIKPENILVAGSGQYETPKITDFGLVAVIEDAAEENKKTRRMSKGPILTCEYAAPEQWAFMAPRDLDGRTDLYALGSVFFELLTGSLPFDASGRDAWMTAHLRTPPPAPSRFRPEIAQWKGLDQLVLWLLEKDRNNRPGNVPIFLNALAQVQHAPGSVRRTSDPPPLVPPVVPRPPAPRPPAPRPPQAPQPPPPGPIRPYLPIPPMPKPKMSTGVKVVLWLMGVVGAVVVVLVIVGIANYSDEQTKLKETPIYDTTPSACTLSFEKNSSVLTPDDRTCLDSLAKRMQANTALVMHIAMNYPADEDKSVTTRRGTNAALYMENVNEDRIKFSAGDGSGRTVDCSLQ